MQPDKRTDRDAGLGVGKYPAFGPSDLEQTVEDGATLEDLGSAPYLSILGARYGQRSGVEEIGGFGVALREKVNLCRVVAVTAVTRRGCKGAGCL